MRRITVLIALLLLAAKAIAGEQLFTHQPTTLPELAKVGSHGIGVQTIEVVNPGQLNTADFESLADRALTLEVWYPATVSGGESKAVYNNVTRLHKSFSLQGEAIRDASPKEGQYPLVVLSHGYTGYRTIMFYLGEHLASHGYVVVGIDHTDSTNEDIDFVNNGGAGFVSTLLNRARDQQFILNHFSELDNAIGKITDTDAAAVIGYSMGGFGAINTVGGCYAFSEPGLQRLGFPAEAAKALLPLFNFCSAGNEKPDSRWKAMVAFAPWGQELNVHQPDSLANITVPSLYIAGDQDDVSGYEHGVKKLFEQTGGENTFLMTYQNARHNFAPHPAPKVAFDTDVDIGHYFEPAWNSETLTRINEHMTLAFLDCFVKGDQARCDYLPKRESITEVKQIDGSFTEAWPGFAHRWGTGVTFSRKAQ